VKPMIYGSAQFVESHASVSRCTFSPPEDALTIAAPTGAPGSGKQAGLWLQRGKRRNYMRPARCGFVLPPRLHELNEVGLAALKLGL
jgi:hypothetical protein